MSAARRTLSYSLGSLAPLVLAIALLAWSLGRPGIWLAGLASLPWLAWRYDNEAFFPLAVLLLLVLGVLGLLLFLVTLVFFAGR